MSRLRSCLASPLALVLALSLTLPSPLRAQDRPEDLSAPPAPERRAPSPAPAPSPARPVVAPSPASSPAAAQPNASTNEPAPPNASTNEPELPEPDNVEVPPPPRATTGSTAPGAIPEPPTARYPRTAPRDPLAVDENQLRIPPRVATRLRILDRDLSTLGSRGNSHIVDGILSILVGGLVVTLGVLVDDQRLSPYFYVYGGSSAVRGVVDVAVTPNASDSSIEFAHLPMGSAAEVRDRLQFGETALESIADRARLARILDSAINIASGVAVIPLYLGPNDFKVASSLDVFVLIGSGISIISGVVNLFTRTEAERRWAAYRDLRQRFREERSRERARGTDGASQGPSVDLSLQGLGLGLTGRF